MTLTVYKDMLQHSDEWYEVRRGMLTASTIGQLIAPKTVKVAANAETRALTAKLVAERITGWAEDGYVSRDMERGTFEEPIARAYYAEHYAPVELCGFMVRKEPGFRIGWSPDGLVDDEGGIEIKSRNPKEQLATIIADGVPAGNMAQIQTAIFVSGRQWIDYVSFCGGWPLYVKRVLPDPAWQAAIVDAAIDWTDATGATIDDACNNLLAAVIAYKVKQETTDGELFAVAFSEMAAAATSLDRIGVRG